MADVISVSELNHYVKTLLDVNDGLFDLALRGEIANFVQNARSGHCYFSLRDDACSVKAVMFRTDARRLAFRPEEGMRVVVRCRATLYERDGAFQVYVNEMFPDGLGAAQLALEPNCRSDPGSDLCYASAWRQMLFQNLLRSKSMYEHFCRKLRFVIADLSEFASGDYDKYKYLH